MTKTNGTPQSAWRRMVISPAVATVIGAGLALSACGGGGDLSSSTPAASNGAGGTGDSAGNGGMASGDSFTTSDAFIALVQKLVASTDETSEPLSFPATAAAPASDTTEPAATGS